MRRARVVVVGIVIAALFVIAAHPARAADDATEPPVVPVGFDAYRQWDKWPLQRIGARAYMRSTYDRRGRNEGGQRDQSVAMGADDRDLR